MTTRRASTTSSKRPRSQRPAAPAKQSLPAKLLRPAASGLVPRDRLFSLLDERLRARIVWISGPGGAGKTSLVSTYIEARALDCLWYQVDASDADLASVTHYLSLAVRDSPGEPLPAFTAAHFAALEAFARRFFEAFFDRLTEPIVIVFDDYQEVGADSRFHDLVVALLDRLPGHVRVVVLSRAEPPAALAKWSLDPGFTTIDWRAVQFSPEEAAALARSWGIERAEELSALHGMSRGWAAGMVMMLRAAQRGVDLRSAQREPPRQLFDYFASQVWSRIPAATQSFLYRTAFLPHMTAATAQALSGDARAARILADLHGESFFTDRRPGPESVYEYHPLFREFLAVRAAEALDPAALAALKRQAATLLEESGQVAAAAELLIGASDWSGLGAFVERRAERMVDQARFQTLRTWLDALPPERLAAAPWLLVWLGLCKAVARDATFRRSLERACELFDAAGDLVGSCAARGWMFQTAASAAEIEELLAEVQAQLRRHGPVKDRQVEARIIRHFNPDYRVPARHPQWTFGVERADRLARRLPEPAQRVRLAAFAGLAYSYSGETAKLRSVIAAAEADLAAPGVSVRDRYVFLNVQSAEAFLSGEFAAAHDATATLRANPAASPLDQMGPVMLELRHALVSGDVDAVRKWEERLNQTPTFVTRMRGNHLQYSTLARLACGDLDGARSIATELASIMTPRSVGFSMALANRAMVELASGADEEARATLERAVAVAREQNGPHVLSPALLLLAVAEHRLGRTDELAHLREGMRLAREMRCITGRPLLSRPLFVEVVELALEHGIEVDHARAIAARLKLQPRSEASAAWPWPLAIRTLGRFEVARDGAPLEVRGKAQKKPLELLKALVALGAEGVEASRIAAALWPDADGDAAKASFDTTLYRLRKLLGLDTALVLAEGKLSLDRRQCWVDVWAFERIARAAEACAQAGDAPPDEALRLGRALLDAYPGHFLTGEEDARWAIDLRDRLRARLLRSVLGLGHQLQAARRWDDGVALYDRALELDNLAEELYRGLMICHRERGQPAAALQAYRRCRELFSVVLGLAPSAETEAVRRTLDRPL
jgi:ATP/maltotriose-dependent transcriptional regulator MalT/DNA-binding SARP family transcriptional activator